MDRDEIIKELGQFLSDETLQVHKIVEIMLLRLRGGTHGQAAVDAVLFLKESSWQKFATAAGLEVSDFKVMARHLIFQNSLISKIDEFWDGFIRRLGEPE